MVRFRFCYSFPQFPKTFLEFGEKSVKAGFMSVGTMCLLIQAGLLAIHIQFLRAFSSVSHACFFAQTADKLNAASLYIAFIPKND